jgi:hypothetical protein
MAKRKQSAATSNGGSSTSTRAKRSSTASPGARSKKNERAGPRGNDLSNDLIGQTAGVVWKTLADNGSQTMASLKKSVDAPSDLVLLAVGWLAREDKLEFDSSGRTTTISLRQEL